jgi:hypothetical protein
MGAEHLSEIYYRDSIEAYGVVDIEPDRAKPL